MSDKKILDATCGSRTIWFNKEHPAAIYCDIRKEELTGIWKSGDGQSERTCYIDPDIQCDFTDLPFPDESFFLVVFDPPHLRYAGKTGWLAKKYGRLDEHGYSGAESLESYRSETIVRASQRKAIGNILGMLHERTSINKTTKELRND